MADLCRRLRQVLEGQTARDWVQGEVAGVRQVSSGHCYFSLKDEREEAMLDCVAYRFHALKVRRHLAEGARVQVQGRVTFWAPRGRTQFLVEQVRPAGKGALLEQLLLLKQRLAEEGLFEESRKRPLPRDARCIGVVTSRDGAAWHDIRTIALRRGSPHLILSPAVVQGEGAADSLIAALDRLERQPGLDVLIVGRGGGSFEDLLAFSDERVVRRVAACSVPVVSAVGHEIDTSLCDLAADVRAATPSEAAELVVADAAERSRQLARLATALARAQRNRITEDRHALSRVSSRVSDPRFLIAHKQQWLDDLRARSERVLLHAIRSRRALIRRWDGRLLARHPQIVLGRARTRTIDLWARLERVTRARLAGARRALVGNSARLEALGPLAILARGYSITLDARGAVVRQADQARAGEPLVVRLHRGALDVVVEQAHVDVSDRSATPHPSTPARPFGANDPGANS